MTRHPAISLAHSTPGASSERGMDGRNLRARTKIEAFVGSLHRDVQQERRAVWVRRLCALCCERKQRITIEFVRIDGDAVFSPLPLSGFTGELPLSASGLMHGGRIHRQPVAAL